MSRPKKAGERPNRNLNRKRRQQNRNRRQLTVRSAIDVPSEEDNHEPPKTVESAIETRETTTAAATTTTPSPGTSGIVLPGDLDGSGIEDSDMIQPVVAKSQTSSVVPKAADDFAPKKEESLSDGLSDSEIPLVVVRKNPEEPPPQKKERKASSAGCVGGSFSSEGVRGYQEDRFTVNDGNAFYAVYDGHGGDKASKYCDKHMMEYVMENMDKLAANPSDADVESAFKEAFIALDDKFLEKRVDDGSTACVAHIIHDGKKGKLYVANAGDTRAIVVNADQSLVEMSQDHKPDLPSEKKRIEAAYHDVEYVSAIIDGKRIRIARVDGNLAVARAIGDGSLKDMNEPEKCAVTCVPEVRSLEIDPAKHRFLVIACDGIWDVYSNEEVAQIVMKELGDKKKPISVDDLNHAAETVVNGALDRDSADNCTVVIAAL